MSNDRSNPRTSVIIPTFNKARYLDLSLASWCHQRDTDYELVILDDGSTDDTAAVVDRYRDRLPIQYRRIENSGRAAARNRALEMARGYILAFCDDDRIVHPDFVSAHASTLTRAPHDTLVLGWQYGFLGEIRPQEPLAPENALRVARARPDLPIGREPVWVAKPEDFAHDLGILDLLQLPEPWFEDYVMPVVREFGEDITECTMAWVFGTTGNMSLTRALLDRVGGFDESFRNWGIEDTEMCYRLQQAGARIRVSRGAVNYHQNHPRDKRALMQSWITNAQVLFQKHETLEVALYLRMTLTGLSVAEAHRTVRESRSIEGTTLLNSYKRLLFSTVRQLAANADSTSCEW